MRWENALVADPEPSDVASAAPAADASQQRRSLRTLGIVLAVVVVGLVIAGAFLPRWWSHRIADQAGGSFTSGILLGLFYGFAFTLLALGVLWLGLSRFHTWKGRVLTVAVALLVAFPNVLTASIVLGWGNAAHAGERTLDVEAPGFRWSTLLGVLAAASVALLLGYLVQSRREARERARELEARLDDPPHPTDA
jgi:hypothetical protein